MNKELTTQEQIALAKEILQVKNRRERSLKLGEILEREKLSVNDMYVLYNTLLSGLAASSPRTWRISRTRWSIRDVAFVLQR